MAVDSEENIRRLKEYELIRLCVPDLNGLSLCKLVPSRHARNILTNKVEIYSGIIAFGPRFEMYRTCLTITSFLESWNRKPHPDSKHVPIAEVEELNHASGYLKPYMSTLHPCVWLHGNKRDISVHSSVTDHRSPCPVGSLICDLLWPNEEMNEASPRIVASKLVDRLRSKHNLRLFSAFEPEFRLFWEYSTKNIRLKPDANAKTEHGYGVSTPMPVTDGQDMHKTNQTVIYENFVLDVDRQMNDVGINIQDYLHENGSGQLETPLIPKFGLEAADDCFTYKQAIREIAKQHGMTASFMTSPLLNESANGNHYNCSLWHHEKNENAFYDPDELELEGNMTDIAFRNFDATDQFSQFRIF